MATYCYLWLLLATFGFQLGCRPHSLWMAPSRWRRGAAWRGCGAALPSQCTFPKLAPIQNIFRRGRAKISEYVIREFDKGGSKWLNAVSKWQCEIAMNNTWVFLREKSSNGIWVNSNKLGNDNMWPLKHNWDIWLEGIKEKLLIFTLVSFLVGRQCNTLRVSEVTHRSYFQRDLLISTVVTLGPNRRIQIDGSK